jgi:hypothetical protein
MGQGPKQLPLIGRSVRCRLSCDRRLLDRDQSHISWRTSVADQSSDHKRDGQAPWPGLGSLRDSEMAGRHADDAQASRSCCLPGFEVRVRPYRQVVRAEDESQGAILESNA